MTIRVLLADDQALLRGAFRVLIDAEDDMEVVGEAADGREAVELARTTRPDVVLMDIRMPGVDGLSATAAICGDPDLMRHPGAHPHHLRDRRVRGPGPARRSPAASSARTPNPPNCSPPCAGSPSGEPLLSAAATRAVIDRLLAQPDPDRAPAAAPERLAALTAREREVMAMAATGLSNEEIAARMYVSPFTVRTHIHRAMSKLDARDRAQLVALAYRTGLVRTPCPASGPND